MNDGVYEIVNKNDIEETVTPEKVTRGEGSVSKVVKFTARTFKSFKAYRVRKAIEKYNKRYQEMKENLEEAKRVQQRVERGDASVDQDRVDYALYDSERAAQKLAKLGVKLLKKEGVLKVIRKNTSARPKKIKVPTKLLREIVRQVDTIRSWNATRKIRKELKKTLPTKTEHAIKQYIDNAFGAVNKDNTKLNTLADQIAEKLSAVNIHTFVPGYDPFEDEIKKVRTTSELPPVEEPEPTKVETKVEETPVEKQEKKVPTVSEVVEAKEPAVEEKEPAVGGPKEWLTELLTQKTKDVEEEKPIEAPAVEEPEELKKDETKVEPVPSKEEEDRVKRLETMVRLHEQRIRLSEQAQKTKCEVRKEKLEKYINNIDKALEQLKNGKSKKEKPVLTPVAKPKYKLVEAEPKKPKYRLEEAKPDTLELAEKVIGKRKV